ncbi:CopG family transcriptional regulator [Salinigranum rubrum]|uniref:CopG family transcriptional regulator n=1 Tax=Salinigranum rubrum TaxID=755307 RepID=A0A2I8VKS6_9EURY|nr:CopG family transcriptional regulator [Salinigranum rubrum]AUV82521.1 CopG family transcriptional regulator [Salinigranum rubrum]
MKTVEIDDSIYEKIEDRIAQNRFDGVDEYVEFILAEVIFSALEQDDGADTRERIDKEEVESRLESLGYIDS